VIRQAISCDICASEKKQTNHWFVAYEQGGELRVTGWGARNRLRPGTKHLCGQTCLHKLVDDFMARAVAARVQAAASGVEEVGAEPHATDISLTSSAAFEDFESSARLIAPPAAPIAVPSHASAYRAQPELVSMAPRLSSEKPTQPPVEAPRFASRAWHAEAWEREREREMRAVAHHPEIARRRSSA
jgi:hypothetical protein